MKTILISLLLRIVTQLTSKSVIRVLKALVTAAMDADMTGAEKRNSVLTALSSEIDVHKYADYLINLALEAVVSWAKSKQ